MAAGAGGKRGAAVVALLAIGLIASGCAGSGAQGAAASPPATASAWVRTVTTDAGALRTRFEGLARELGVPGAAMLVRTPQGEITATYGVTQVNGTTPVSLDDHFRIGSNTKTMTATVILQLVKEGRISLADKVAKYRPDVPNGSRITIEQLLTMRSGLANYTTTLALNTALDTQPQRAWNPEELVAMGLAEPPTFEPGDGWNYSNTNTVLLGLIAEQLEGKPLAEIFQERLFTPLGLRETTYPAVSDSTLPEPYSHGYMYSTNVDTMASNVLPPAQLAQAKAGTLLPSDTTRLNPSWAGAAGAGISTIRDLAHWVEALGSGAVLGPALQKERLASVEPVPVPLPPLPDPQYGWGIAKIGPLYGHTGELPGYNSFMGYDPVQKVTIVVWTNLAPAADGRPPAATIATSLMKSIYGG
ncbi:serine hydrolase domain-containing protein [Microbacterium azadirachtae]|uniref:serine hydrolase domain-containing protein n=1 Tax=Microbacterium azadirachtae TaxID=582680 RepID=UPI0008830826|nr:serine hydrolase domain-containing protein [Microbacterium azadirachtae]SDL70685.1 D-alanyl-D-alanine carboxypeptidase [Microbacterium azadirachtae]SEG00323.1 D-alanyl-D-alanine carboxypeptidase [Microbacterium azadirachtae]SEG02658.1 D-alanyl-D-alanine carboxypeptidase [Microbacterium azadirachtae]